LLTTKNIRFLSSTNLIKTGDAQLNKKPTQKKSKELFFTTVYQEE